ncbi:hypothetical protein [Methylobacterium pseudosasicola]|uniref:hypothetical protein n=1 Tax=Methylobacterium pseudosasicola TaxID=582667 RepID=UPI000B8A1B12|nr:hypothetical protein [Methylobacterium pseudosasicola]
MARQTSGSGRSLLWRSRLDKTGSHDRAAESTRTKAYEFWNFLEARTGFSQQALDRGAALGDDAFRDR